MPNFTAGTSFTDGVTNDVTALKLNALIADAVPTSSLALNSTTGTIGLFSSGTGTAATPAIQPTGDTNTGLFFPAADTIAFAEGGAEAMRIDSSGNVLTGGLTSSPSQADGNSTSGQVLALNTKRELRWSGTNASIYGGSGGADDNIYYYSGLNHIFRSNNTERLRIDSSGNLLVGTTSTGQTSGEGIKITPSGDGAGIPRISIVTPSTTNAQNNGISFYSTGALAYRFYVGAGGTVFATNTTISAISDIRYKENIRELDIGLGAIMELKPRVFDWKDGKGKNIKNDRGFVAQEFEEVFPDLVDEWQDEAPQGEEPYKSVRQDLIPVLVKAIQELKAKNDILESKVAALEAA